MKIRVILMGDAEIYHLLDRNDPDFGDLFKVLADFGTTIERDAKGIGQYAGVLARIVRDEDLPPLNRKAVAALVEHGARVAGHGRKLTARFGRIADIAREAAWLAAREDKRRIVVDGSHVREAIRRTKHRADLPSRRFQELLSDGTIQVQTSGEVVGQINGLAVMSAGPLIYGFPARITATVGAGTTGIINIEEQSALSGSIHTKGFQILGGLLRSLLRTDHPLAFTASLAFEQSYGGIDGDSASGAEICCLLSALTGVPLRQGVAMTGSIDQMGHVQAVGGVNEKIEGFFDTCLAAGLTGDQGVILPVANAQELMLRPDVVDACRKKKFSVWTAECIHDALEILTGVPAGRRDPGDGYPEGTLLAAAQAQAREFWLRALQTPTPAEAVRERIVAADGSAARFKPPL
jgi:ATP-dependent Lon protease